MSDSRSWSPRADVLAEHAFTRLVNRTDVWGEYLAPGRRYLNRHGELVRSLTMPKKALRGRVTLTRRHLEEHFRGRVVRGVHTTSVADTSLHLDFDFDNHGDEAGAFALNVALCARLVAALAEMGFVAIVEDSGGGGLHVWTLFDVPAPTRNAFSLGCAVLREARRGAPDEIADLPVELFPKQGGVRGGYGNWLRLPGRHHSRDHWSRIRGHHRWESGTRGADLWLNAPLNDASRVPEAPAIEASRVHVIEQSEPITEDQLSRRIAAYRAKLPTGLVAKSGRADVAFSFALWLIAKRKVSDERALRELQQWNRQNTVPLSDAKLVDTIANANIYRTRLKDEPEWPLGRARFTLATLASQPARSLMEATR
jgi:hypothetical protein